MARPRVPPPTSINASPRRRTHPEVVGERRAPWRRQKRTAATRVLKTLQEPHASTTEKRQSSLLFIRIVERYIVGYGERKGRRAHLPPNAKVIPGFSALLPISAVFCAGCRVGVRPRRGGRQIRTPQRWEETQRVAGGGPTRKRAWTKRCLLDLAERPLWGHRSARRSRRSGDDPYKEQRGLAHYKTLARPPGGRSGAPAFWSAPVLGRFSAAAAGGPPALLVQGLGLLSLSLPGSEKTGTGSGLSDAELRG